MMRGQPPEWPARGSVYAVELPHGGELVLVVSSDARNQHWPSAVVARIITRESLGELEPILLGQQTVVSLGDLEPVQGVALLDFLYTLDQEDIPATSFLGKVTAEAMQAVNGALISALDLPPYEFIQE